MGKRVGLPEMIYEQVKALPEPLAREVLDFAAALTERTDRVSWRDLMTAQGHAMAGTWDNAEDAVWDDF